MNFKHWLLNEEIWDKNNATVYHRIESVKDVSSLLTSDFKAGAGKGCQFGCGLYANYAIESQFRDVMQMYGYVLIKFKLTNLDKYLVFQLSVAKQIHGKDYKLSDQLKKLGVLNKVLDKNKLKEYDERQETGLDDFGGKFVGNLALDFYGENKWIENSIKGIIYFSKGDGYCLVKYNPVQDGTITMLGYAVAETNDMEKMQQLKNNIGWITTVGRLGTPIKRVYNSTYPNKEKFAFDGKNEMDYAKKIFLNSENLELTAKKLESHINKFSDSDISYLLDKATDKDKMAEVIAKSKTNFSDDNLTRLLNAATDDNKDKMAELIIQKKPELSDKDISYLLDKANEKDKIAELIIQKKQELSDNDVETLIVYAIEKEKFLDLILKKLKNSKSLISDRSIGSMTYRGKDRIINDIIQVLQEKNQEISLQAFEHFVEYATDKLKIAMNLIKIKKQLSLEEATILIRNSKDRKEMAKLIDKPYSFLKSFTNWDAFRYKKSPEVQEIINKYLEPQAIAAK